MVDIVSPEVFFLWENGQFLLWNCKTHEQYLLKEKFVSYLQSTDFDQNDKIFTQLYAAGVMSTDNAENKKPWGWDSLSRLFHIGTKDVPSSDISQDPKTFSKRYLQECAGVEHEIADFFQEKDTAIVDLPKPEISTLNAPFHKTIYERKTSRVFHGQPISIQELSNLLFASFGLIHGEWQELNEADLKIAGIRKASPSSGGLHAEEAYIAVFHVDGLEKGLYYYRPQDHRLNLILSGDFEEKIIRFNKNQAYSKGLSVGIYLTARLDKYWWKYSHSRTYRIMLMDIGHVSQTLLLAATAMGLQTWMTGAFDDSDIEHFLGIDGYRESVMLYVGIGHGDKTGFPKQFFSDIT